MLQVFTAFSRDQEDKVYVQHRVAENAPLLWRLIAMEGGAVFVAGNAKQMPQGVREAFLEVFRKEGGLEESAAVNYLQAMENQKRYQVETWAWETLLSLIIGTSSAMLIELTKSQTKIQSWNHFT